MNILWIDIETTGLNPIKDSLLEIAVVETTVKGDIKNKYQSAIRFTTENAEIDDYVMNMHTVNNLFEDCRSARIYSMHQLDVHLCGLFNAKQYTIAGNSVHFDRSFLKEKTPLFEDKFHHRHLDISSVSIFLEHCGIVIPKTSSSRHRAMDDIESCMRQYFQYYNLVSGKKLT